MIAKILVGVVALVGLAGGGAYLSGNAPSCCYPGSPCCDGGACCLTQFASDDCCAPGAACCPGSCCDEVK